MSDGDSGPETIELDLADRCIDGGTNHVPEMVAREWRARWQAEQGNDPARIAAGVDPLEQLARAGLLRDSAGGGIDWASDALAEQIFFRALSRRDPELSGASVRTWLALARTQRLDGALVHVAAALWKAGRVGELLVILDTTARFSIGAHESELQVILDLVPGGRARGVLSRMLVSVAPLGAEAEVHAEAERFGAGIDELCHACVETRKRTSIETLKETLLGDVCGALQNRQGSAPALRRALPGVAALVERLVELEPENTNNLRTLSSVLSKLGRMNESVDPQRAREWWGVARMLRSTGSRSRNDRGARGNDLELVEGGKLAVVAMSKAALEPMSR